MGMSGCRLKKNHGQVILIIEISMFKPYTKMYVFTHLMGQQNTGSF